MTAPIPPGYRPWPATWHPPRGLSAKFAAVAQIDRARPMAVGATVTIRHGGTDFLALKHTPGVGPALLIPDGAHFGAEPREWPRLWREAPLGIGLAIGAVAGGWVFGAAGAFVGALVGLVADFHRREGESEERRPKG